MSDNMDKLRNRPYDGQMHTDHGGRGKTLVTGLTMRDIADCFMLAAFDSSYHLDQQAYEEAQNWEFKSNKIYGLDWNKIDPVAVRQNLTCRIEKMMGIYPNVPELVKESEVAGDEINGYKMRGWTETLEGSVQQLREATNPLRGIEVQQ